jgi:hypothetical protein
MKRLLAVMAVILAGAALFAQDISLPAPKAKFGLDLADALKMRTTSRTFVSTEVQLADLSTILWACNGPLPADAVSAASKAGRTIPYSGDFAYINVYVFTAKGAYLYVPEKNLLKQVAKGELRDKVTTEFVKTSPVMLLFSIDPAKLPDFLRKIPSAVDSTGFGTAGESIENAVLTATSLKLGTIVMYNLGSGIPALAGFAPNEKPLSLIQLGYTK